MKLIYKSLLTICIGLFCVFGFAENSVAQAIGAPKAYIEIARSTKLGLFVQFYFYNQNCSNEERENTESGCLMKVYHTDLGIPLFRGSAIKSKVKSYLVKSGTYILEKMYLQLSTITDEHYNIGKSGPSFVVGVDGDYSFGRVQIIEGFTQGKVALWKPAESRVISDACAKEKKISCEIIIAHSSQEEFKPDFSALFGEKPKW
jgi:hypothetical protein